MLIYYSDWLYRFIVYDCYSFRLKHQLLKNNNCELNWLDCGTVYGYYGYRLQQRYLIDFKEYGLKLFWKMLHYSEITYKKLFLHVDQFKTFNFGSTRHCTCRFIDKLSHTNMAYPFIDSKTVNYIFYLILAHNLFSSQKFVCNLNYVKLS